MVNVWGDSVGAGVVERLNRAALAKEDANMFRHHHHHGHSEKPKGMDNGGYMHRGDDEINQSHL